MGACKATLILEGRPLVWWHAVTLRRRCARVVVVVGAHRDAVATALPRDAGVEIRENPRWQATGPTDSLAIAIARLDLHTPALITPVDVPPAPPRVVDRLLAHDGPAIAATDGRPGHPVRLSVAAIQHAIRGGGTLRDATAGATLIDAAWSCAHLNLNRPEDWQRWTATKLARLGCAEILAGIAADCSPGVDPAALPGHDAGTGPGAPEAT